MQSDLTGIHLREELAADTEMLEWVCNDSGRSGLEHWVGKASDERKGEVPVASETLAKYIGTYEEQAPYWRTVARVVEITVSDNKLFADMDGRGKVPLIASSEIAFSGLYGLAVESIQGGSGDVERSTARNLTPRARVEFGCECRRPCSRAGTAAAAR